MRPVHHGHVRAIENAFKVVRHRHVFGHENVRGHLRCRRISRQRARRVAGRRRREVLESIMFCHGHGHRHTACLERPGRVRAFFLHEQPGMTTARQHRGPAFAQAHRLRIRQHVRIAPHAQAGTGVCGHLRRALPLHRLSQRLHVIPHIQRARIHRANILRRLRRNPVPAPRALQKKLSEP